MTDSRDAVPLRRRLLRRAGRPDPVATLTGPGLGEWDLRALVGHTSRSLVTVETYLDPPADDIAVPTAADYYLAIAGSRRRRRGRRRARRRAGLGAGRRPRGVRRATSRAASARSSTAYDDGVPAHHDRRRDAARRVPPHPHLRAGRPRPRHRGRLGRRPGVRRGSRSSTPPRWPPRSRALTGRGPELLLALTGRRPLPAGFSIV